MSEPARHTRGQQARALAATGGDVVAVKNELSDPAEKGPPGIKSDSLLLFAGAVSLRPHNR